MAILDRSAHIAVCAAFLLLFSCATHGKLRYHFNFNNFDSNDTSFAQLGCGVTLDEPLGITSGSVLGSDTSISQPGYGRAGNCLSSQFFETDPMAIIDETQDPLDTGSFSYNVWVKFDENADDATNRYAFLFNTPSLNYRHWFRRQNSYEYIYFRTVSGSVSVGHNPPQVELGEWYMWTISYDVTSQLRIYYNATLVRSVNARGPYRPDPNSLHRIGMYYYTAGFRTDIIVDEMSFFDHALSEDEILALYSRGTQLPFYQGFVEPFDQLGPMNIDPVSGFPLANIAIDTAKEFVLEPPPPTEEDLSIVWTAINFEDCCDTTGVEIDLAPGNASADLSVPLPGSRAVQVQLFTPYSCPTVTTALKINPLAPTIKLPLPEVFEAVIGEEAVINVGFTGNPAPRVQWQEYFNSSESASRRGFEFQQELWAPMPRGSINDTNCTIVNGTLPGNGTNVTNPCIDPGDGDNTTGTNFTEGWVDLPGETSSAYLFMVNETDDGRLLRALVYNLEGDETYTNATRIRARNPPEPDSSDAVDKLRDLGPALGGAFALLLSACCVVLTCCCCCITVALVLAISGAVGRSAKREDEWLQLTPPDYERVAYGEWCEPLYRLSEKQEDVFEKMEEVLVENMNLLSPLLLEATMPADMDKACMGLLVLMDRNNLAYELVANQIAHEALVADQDGSNLFPASSGSSKLFARFARMVGVEWLFQSFAAMLLKLDLDVVKEKEARAQDALEGEDGEELIGRTRAFTASGDDVGVTGAFATFDMMSMTSVNPTHQFGNPQGGPSEGKYADEGDDMINVMQLQLRSQAILKMVLGRGELCAPELLKLMGDIATALKNEDFSEDTIYIAQNSFFFLRYICPALSAPQAFGLTEEPFQMETTRTMLLVTKLLQNLCSNTLPGSQYPDSPELVDAFVMRNVPKVKKFYQRYEEKPPVLEERYIDEEGPVMNALAYMHSLLKDGVLSTMAKNAPDGGPELEEVVSELEDVCSRCSPAKML